MFAIVSHLAIFIFYKYFNSMKNTFFLILIFICTTRPVLSQPDSKPSPLIKTMATDPKYGYEPTRKFAIKVGSVKNEYAFIAALAGPTGQKISAVRIGSCCEFRLKRAVFGKAFLDKWEITWANQDTPVIIFLNPYEFETPKCPIGLTIAETPTTTVSR
jgi:hypothetical protein